MKYEWDEDKAAADLSKHGIRFEEAKTAFNDPLYVDFYDPDHSYGEHRYILIGGNHIKNVCCLFRIWNITMSFG